MPPTQQQAAARSQSNLAFALVSLEPHRKEAMGVFYDYCRLVDDIADEPVRTIPQKYGELLGWQKEILSWKDCWENQSAPVTLPAPENISPISPETALAQTMRAITARYRVNPQHLIDILCGVWKDVEPTEFANFEELRDYCYGVACAVGHVSIKIFGCTHPNSEKIADALGYALQFTNILRDIREDFEEKGRVYLPQDELTFFGVTPEILLSDTPHTGRDRLLRLQYFRAKHFFNRARRLVTEQDKQALVAATGMGAIYEEILETIRRRDFSLKNRVSLSKIKKLQLLTKAARTAKKPIKKPLREPGTAVVFGAGVAGISSALLLAKEGFDVELYEAKRVPGGRACSLNDAKSGLVLDNGQHIAMGCYESFLGIAELLGVTSKLRKNATLDVTYVDKGGARFSLKAPNLPLGLGMLWGLLKFKKLSAKDKWAIIRFAIALRMGAKPKPNETAAQWLARHGQTKNSIHALWRPFCVAALNQELDTGDAALLYETLVRSLFGNADAAAIYFSKVPLGELFYPEAERFLKSIGSRAQLGAQVTALEFENGKITGFKVGDAPQVRTADLYISAMNWQALGALLEGKSPLAQTLKKIPSAGILNAHILSDKKWFAEPFVGFLDSPIQWVFDRSDLLPKEKQGTHFLYALTLSAPGPWETRGTKEISEMLRAELSSHFPQAAQSEFLREIVVKTLDATFAATPETEQLRPNAQNENGLMLAGDYTATALPATLESAALSARKLVDKIDHPPLP